MANAPDNQACDSFAALFAQLLARVLNDAAGAAWQIAPASPPSARLPVLDMPVQYSLRFGGGLRGICYAVFSRADLVALGGGEEPAAQDADREPGDAPAIVLERMRSVAATLSEALAGEYGAVTAVAGAVDVLDPKAAFALELQGKDGQGKTAVILLHFDADLQTALAAASPKSSPAAGKSLNQANLGLVMDVELNCTLRFGQRQLTLREILDLASGSVVELDRQVDEPVELILDGKVIARGEAVVIDGNYGLRVTQVLHTVGF